MTFDRRQTTRMLLGLAGGAALNPALTLSGARAQDAATGVTRAFGSSLVGEPRYGEDMAHFDYVNPDAPKGGRARLAA